MTNTDDVLCQYQAAEDRGIDLLKQLRTFAPSEEIGKEIDQQIIDETKHERLFSERLDHLEIDCQGLNNSLEDIYDLAQKCVDEKDWVKSIAIQTVIEELAMATFTEHVEELDEDSQTVLREIIQDEARHLEFGLRELDKVREGNEEKIEGIHKQVLEIFQTAFVNGSYSKEDLPIMVKTVTKAYGMHKKRLGGIGIQIPEIDVASIAAAML